MHTGQPKCTTYKNYTTLSILSQLEEWLRTDLSKTSPCRWRRTCLWNCRSIENKKTTSKTAELYLISFVRILNTSVVLFTCSKDYWLLQIIYRVQYSFLFAHTHYSPCIITVLIMWAWLGMAYVQCSIILSCRFHHIWFTYLNNISNLFKSPWIDSANLKNRVNSIITMLGNFCLTIEKYLRITLESGQISNIKVRIYLVWCTLFVYYCKRLSVSGWCEHIPFKK